jgi:hypothetical protein
MVKKDKNFTTKKHNVNVLFFWVKLSALGVLVVKHLKLSDG